LHKLLKLIKLCKRDRVLLIYGKLNNVNDKEIFMIRLSDPQNSDVPMAVMLVLYIAGEVVTVLN
jgi:hypothetical protein